MKATNGDANTDSSSILNPPPNQILSPETEGGFILSATDWVLLLFSFLVIAATSPIPSFCGGRRGLEEVCLRHGLGEVLHQ